MSAGRLLLAFAVVFGLAACDDPPAPHKETLYVFGTLVEFTLRGVSEEQARAAVAAVEKDFRRMHKDWHAWKPGELTDLNAAFAAGKTREVTPFLLPLIRQAKDYFELSGGLFNPAIGRLIGAWGFHADELPKGSLPPFDEIRTLASQAPSMDDVVIEGDRVSSRNPSVALDFGGFAKGVALDMAVARLREMGVENAIVNAGGDLNTMGSADERPWSVGIRHPKHWGVIASVDLADDEVLYTSGNYERFREHEGIRYAHILDPRDGMPVTHIVSASVIHTDGGLADAAATALTVAGPGDWETVAQRMNVRYVLLVDDEGTVYTTPAMKKRVRFEPGEPKSLVIGNLQ